jgi:hypothetical protein
MQDLINSHFQTSVRCPARAPKVLRSDTSSARSMCVIPCVCLPAKNGLICSPQNHRWIHMKSLLVIITGFDGLEHQVESTFQLSRHSLYQVGMMLMGLFCMLSEPRVRMPCTQERQVKPLVVSPFSSTHSEQSSHIIVFCANWQLHSSHTKVWRKKSRYHLCQSDNVA